MLVSEIKWQFFVPNIIDIGLDLLELFENKILITVYKH